MKSYRHIFARIIGKPLLLEAGYANVFFSALSDRLGLESIAADQKEFGKAAMAAMVDSYSGRDGKKPYTVKSGVAIIPVDGTLAYKTGNLNPESGMTGYDGIKAQLEIASADENVKGAILDISSPGGEASGVSEAAAAIKSFSKPIIAHTGQMAASAAYWLASATNKVVADETAVVGSVGAIIAHEDMTGALDKAGVKIEMIRFGARKAEANSVEPLTDEARTALQQQVDELGTMFAEAVAKNRNLSLDAVLATEAAVFGAGKALELGLVDEVAGFDETLANFANSLAAEAERQSEVNMTEQEISAQLADARKAGAADERARIKAIVDLGHPGANHIAFNTTMSAEDAAALLANIPVAAPVQAAAPAAGASLAALAEHTPVKPDVPAGFVAEKVSTEAIMKDGRFSIAKAAALMAKEGAAK